MNAITEIECSDDSLLASQGLSCDTIPLTSQKSLKVRCVVCGTRFAAKRRSALTCSGKCRTERYRTLKASTPKLPPGPFDLVYADPPWNFDTYSKAGQGKCPSQHYATMDIPAICRLPVRDIAAPDAFLALWVYNPRKKDAFAVAEAWGFPEESGVLFTWKKLTTKNGLTHISTGYSTRKNTEQCWLFKRGRGLRRHDKGVYELVEAKIREHSRKPDEAYRALERLYGDVRRIELFCRRAWPGWTAWGNQLGEAV
jgi:N6-adenosine-specific RNA methylase IME4